VRAIALLVGSVSLVQLLSGLLFLGPHSDMPGRPVSNAVLLGAALGGLALAWALWRRRARAAARGLPLWAAGVAIWVVGLALVIASPVEWREEAVPTLAVALPIWVGCAWLIIRYVRRREGEAA
jgi:hypothetical protein